MLAVLHPVHVVAALPGHRSERIATHYSAVELSRLIEAAERVCKGTGGRPELVVLRGALQTAPANLPQRCCGQLAKPAKSLRRMVPRG